ncbi:hypothetical protein [Lederbergia panacisoli]|uniref:hypothetical protein n=1 Tax=Lederbergia panacisoli TaxID=1255251 RepID=UPI00214AE3FF|nr:hypothetical protein [Lederbergia panacisoli]MCR2823332.1 hypothetical protein [Lederbergia panacisoli]
MGESKQYIWYASYGSNINIERFLCYIKGGKPEGSTKVETGCDDPSLPIDDANFKINYPIYFAKESARWNHQGVAFIGLTETSETSTLSRKFLITEEQFLDVLKQENNGIVIDIDLNEVKEAGSKIFRNNSWYGNILYLGEDDGYPTFTFTAPWDINDVEKVKPSHQYLKTIIEGLKADYSNAEIYAYLINKPGIQGNYSDEELNSLI